MPSKPIVKVLCNNDIFGESIGRGLYHGVDLNKTIRGGRSLLRRYKAVYSEVFFLEAEAIVFRRELLIARSEIVECTDTLNETTKEYEEKRYQVDNLISQLEEMKIQIEEYQIKVDAHTKILKNQIILENKLEDYEEKRRRR